MDKPTPEERRAALLDLEAEIEKVGWGAKPDLMNAKVDAFIDMLRRSQDDSDA